MAGFKFWEHPHEEWRDVRGYPDYEVSNMGRVRSYRQPGRPGHILSARYKKRWGYYQVVLLNREKLVHVLVAEAFLDERPLGHEVNHIDGKKTNNAASNLEWVTRSENLRPAYALGLRTPRKSKLVGATT